MVAIASCAVLSLDGKEMGNAFMAIDLYCFVVRLFVIKMFCDAFRRSFGNDPRRELT